MSCLISESTKLVKQHVTQSTVTIFQQISLEKLFESSYLGQGWKNPRCVRKRHELKKTITLGHLLMPYGVEHKVTIVGAQEKPS